MNVAYTERLDAVRCFDIDLQSIPYPVPASSDTAKRRRSLPAIGFAAIFVSAGVFLRQGDLFVDILPGMNAGDSYGAQAWH